jgi:hypothetical protein
MIKTVPSGGVFKITLKDTIEWTNDRDLEQQKVEKYSIGHMTE